MKDLAKILSVSAASGLLLGLGGCASSQADPDATPAGASAASAEKECCKGKNECEGKGDCRVPGRQECAGMNKCKGQGGCDARCRKKAEAP
ncbi:MAG: hypothetical protein IPM79_01355 [Polyangiaceae bacterium]|jgi:hypothetical protein|nr:hypothetical protein [Polyangiaceae bacterium]MBK8936318.1 hypothetical protein [Polyangiaceae bacterium]